jgi:hypothetical protein
LEASSHLKADPKQVALSLSRFVGRGPTPKRVGEVGDAWLGVNVAPEEAKAKMERYGDTLSRQAVTGKFPLCLFWYRRPDWVRESEIKP